MWIVVSTQHPNKTHPVVESHAKCPLVHDAIFGFSITEDRFQWEENNRRDPRNVENQGVTEKIGAKLERHLESMFVPGGENSHEYVHREEPIRVHGANVVLHVLVVGRHDDKYHKEVESEQHFEHAPQREVLPYPEK